MCSSDLQFCILPYTAKLTTLGVIKTGDFVNIETDMIGKYVERFVRRSHDIDNPKETGKSLDMQFLAKTGFI